MNNQTWNDPGAGLTASGANEQSWLDWVDDTGRRAALASELGHALIDCDPEDRLDILEDAHEFLRAGWPMVPFGSVMDEAVFWANEASPSELKAYCLATFNRMPAKDQAAFLAYVQRGNTA